MNKTNSKYFNIENSQEIRAFYSSEIVRVYQAYNNEIADNALKNQKFVAPWRSDRMTWIKPSAIWMGYRSGWATKDKNQARILAIDLHREAFDSLLLQGILAKEQIKDIQWDPERGLGGDSGKNAYTHNITQIRSLQMGLRGDATIKYGEGSMIKQISDVSELFKQIGELLKNNEIDSAYKLIPQEELYPMPEGQVIVPKCEKQIQNYNYQSEQIQIQDKNVL